MTATALDPLVRSIAGLEDPIGILSVYVGVDPVVEATVRPSWQIEVDDALEGIRHALREEGRHDRRVAFDRRVSELAPAIARLVDASEHGRGRALFAGVGSGEVHTVAVQAALPTCATLGEVPHLVPLLGADEGSVLGLVLIGRNVVRVLETRLGAVDEIARFDVEPVVTDGPERKGPAAPNPLRAQQVAVQRERYERHVEVGHRRLLDEAAHAVSDLAAASGWELAAVAGDPRGGHAVADLLHRHGVAADLVDRDLEALSPSRALQELGQVLAAARHRRDLAFVRRAVDGARSGGRGALGLVDTLAAIDEGRVECLVLDGGLGVVGSVDPAGRLVPPGVVPAGCTESELRLEPLFADRIVLRALASGARVLVVGGEAAVALADDEGIGALLRW